MTWPTLLKTRTTACICLYSTKGTQYIMWHIRLKSSQCMQWIMQQCLLNNFTNKPS